MLANVVFMPVLWFFLTDGGTLTFGGWRLGGLTVLSVLWGSMISIADVLGVWDAVWLVSTAEGRKQLPMYFTKPVHPLIMIYGTGIMPSGILKLAIAVIAMVAFALHFNLTITPAFILLVMFGAIIMLNILNYPIMAMIAYEQSGLPLTDIAWSFLRYSDLPLTRIQGVAALITSVIVPIAFVVAVPAESLLFEPSVSVILMSGLMAVMTTAVGLLLWQFAKAKYEAVGG